MLSQATASVSDRDHFRITQVLDFSFVFKLSYATTQSLIHINQYLNKTAPWLVNGLLIKILYM